jgi:aryl sulfotransferase
MKGLKLQQKSPLPQRLYSYTDGLTDTTRWDHFTPRDDDVFVCTMGKNGTTWMLTICTFLVFGRSDLDFVPADRSTWFDAIFSPVDKVVAHFEAQTNRRIIKTHTPLDGIPFYPQCTYITVWRDPRDAFISMRAHDDNMKIEFGDGDAQEKEDRGAEQEFREHIEMDYVPGVPPSRGLGYRAHFIRSYFDYQHLPNIHFFHYADMKRDLKGEMAKVAKALGIEIDDAKLSQLADAATFSSMKRQALDYVPSGKDGFWHDPAKFLHKGVSGQWEDVFSDETLARFDARFDELLGPELARWIKEGSV